MNEGIKKTYRYSGSYYVTLKIIASHKMNLINKNPYSVTILEARNLKSMLHQPMKTIKYEWGKENLVHSDSTHFLQQDL